MEQCKQLYQNSKIYAYCKYIPEDLIKYEINSLIEQHRPDIIVITGHDVYNNKGKKDINNYLNTPYFIESIKSIRKSFTSNDIIIIAGACQSNFEALIASGANFASSPKRINIHAFDPAILAIKIAHTNITKIVDLKEINQYTYSKDDGFGGLQSYGKMRLLL